MKLVTVAGVAESYRIRSMTPLVVVTRTADSAEGSVNIPASGVSRLESALPTQFDITVPATGDPTAGKTRNLNVCD